MEDEFRNPTEFEVEIIERLLSVDFPRVELLRTQLRTLKVRSVDSDGSLELKVQDGPAAPEAFGIPVEGSYAQGGGKWELFGPKTHILLHVDSTGFMHELEFYNDESVPIAKPDIGEIHVEVN